MSAPSGLVTRLQGDGFVLRPWEPDDVEAVFEACQDEEIQRWTTVPSPYTREDAAYFVEVLSPSHWESGSGAPFAVVDEDGELLGSCGLVRIDARAAEVGYWIAARARRRGIASRAARAVAEWALRDARAERVELLAAVDNVASRRAAEKAGFVFEGVLRQYLRLRDNRFDAAMYSLIAQDLT